MDGGTIYYCRGCGTTFSGEKGLSEEPCPNCNERLLIDTGATREEYRAMSKEQQEYAKSVWQGDSILTTKKCRKCGMNIPYVALKCPYCRSSQRKNRLINIIVTILTILFFLYIFGLVVQTCNTSSSSSTYATSSAAKSLSKFDAAEQKAANMTVEEFKDSAVSVSYDEMKRNPDSHKGDFVVMKLYVAQLVSGTQWRTYTYGNSQWTKYDADEEFYIFDKRKNGTNVIEKDVITVYGVYRGTVEVQRALTKTNEKVPSIDVFHLELNN